MTFNSFVSGLCKLAQSQQTRKEGLQAAGHRGGVQPSWLQSVHTSRRRRGRWLALPPPDPTTLLRQHRPAPAPGRHPRLCPARRRHHQPRLHLYPPCRRQTPRSPPARWARLQQSRLHPRRPATRTAQRRRLAALRPRTRQAASAHAGAPPFAGCASWRVRRRGARVKEAKVAWEPVSTLQSALKTRP